MNTNIGSGQHQFAFFVTRLKTGLPVPNSSYVAFTDKQLVHRVQKVLRLKQGAHCILFDEYDSAQATLIESEKHRLIFSLDEFKAHTVLEPHITWLLPILKREAFEQAVYSLMELGVTEIQPIVTKKSRQGWGSEKEYARIRTLLIAAAEQAKQFNLPKVHPVKNLEELSFNSSSKHLFFHPEGQPISPVIDSFKAEKPSQIIVCSGPEGDLTADEKEYLRLCSFEFSALTPTILRAQQAVVVGLGILRSFL